eukprot:scaffold16163_cov106-Isochrysis_galbana.AAC.1
MACGSRLCCCAGMLCWCAGGGACTSGSGCGARSGWLPGRCLALCAHAGGSRPRRSASSGWAGRIWGVSGRAGVVPEESSKSPAQAGGAQGVPIHSPFAASPAPPSPAAVASSTPAAPPAPTVSSSPRVDWRRRDTRDNTVRA